MLRNFIDYDPYLLVRPGNSNRGRPSSSAALYPSRINLHSPHADTLIQALLRDEENLYNDFRSLNSIFGSGVNNENMRNFRDGAGVGKDDWALVVDTRGFKPDEVNVKLEGNTSTMSGNTEWQSSDGTHKRTKTFSQAISIREDVKMDTLRTKMMDDGSVVVHAEREKKEEKKQSIREIPIERIQQKESAEKYMDIQILASDFKRQTLICFFVFYTCAKNFSLSFADKKYSR